MENKYFTLEEANNMIPFLERSFQRMLQLHRHIQEIFARLERLGLAPQSEEFSLEPAEAPEDAIDDLYSLKVLIDELRKSLTEVVETGCVVKDLGQGLIDWYAVHQEREIFLCWKLGEKEVAFWHEIDKGYKERHPVSELKPTEN